MMSEDQFALVLRWFETLSASVEKMRTELTSEIVSLRGDVHEIRELIAHQQDQLRVHQRAIADVDRRVETLERRS